MTSCLQQRFLKAASSYIQVLYKECEAQVRYTVRLGLHPQISSYGHANIPTYNKNT